MQVTLGQRLRTLVALPLLIIAIVAGGSTGLAGLQLTSAPQPPPTDALVPRQEVRAERVAGRLAEAVETPAPAPAVPPGSLAAWSEEVPDARRHWPSVTTPGPEPAGEAESAAPKASKPSATTTAPKAVASKPREFVGTNHFWMPSLGISKRVHDYPCPRKRPPDHYVYRWWCAGDNNVYLLGHASSVFKPLHDAYVRGRLRVGMAAWYANANGKVTKYRITEWRVVRPEESHWAIANQPVPSMTLQTCVGKNDEFRLNVRLVAVAYL